MCRLSQNLMCSVTKGQAEKANCNTAIWEAEDAVLQTK